MSKRELRRHLGSMMTGIAIWVTSLLVLLVASVAATQGQTNATHDAAPATTAFHHQMDALNEKLSDILARPLPTTAESVSSSTVFGTVFPRGVNLPPEDLVMTVIIASTLLALGPLTLLTLRL